MELSKRGRIQQVISRTAANCHLAAPLLLQQYDRDNNTNGPSTDRYTIEDESRIMLLRDGTRENIHLEARSTNTSDRASTGYGASVAIKSGTEAAVPTIPSGVRLIRSNNVVWLLIYGWMYVCMYVWMV